METRTKHLRFRTNRLWFAPTMIVLTALAGCGDDEPDIVEPPPDPPRAAAISISPNSVTLTSVGETATFTATVTDQFGAAYSGTVTWSSSDSDVFTAGSSGVVTAVADGSGTVTATVEAVSATASVTVEINLPPMTRGDLTDFVLPLAAGGGALPWLPAAHFEDPDNDILELTYSTTVQDTAVASASVIVDSEGHAAVILGGTAPGMTTVTTTATDPGGLSAEQSFAVSIDDSGFTPVPGLTVADNTIAISFLSVVGACTPPIVNVPHTTGYLFTINSSKWQTRADSATAWTDVEDTENTTAQICTYTTQTPGEYRLVMDMTITIDEHHDPIQGGYRAENTFVVEGNPGGGNRAPKLSAMTPEGFPLSVGGGPQFVLPEQHLTDPDGDDLVFSVAVSDSAVVSAELVVDSVGHSIVVARGVGAGSGTVTITATDPEGLTAEMPLSIEVDDTGYTPFPSTMVSNGVLRLFDLSLVTCTPPIINAPGVNGWIYTVHSSKWQTRSDSSAAWTDIDGTEVTDGRMCPYSAQAAGDYRLAYDITIVVEPHLPAFSGKYASWNFFTVSSGG